ncbi:S-layer homology domain-containing protein [Paenibacillus humicola]|uniref:S-layer homology domain-containing protein n=1 Tax=Paenibacillus humicola TaxID=3110540 RepID=UPI00237B093D|nr:S-layer homology domain-containing protein [Paenibacillus humicola]
MMRKGTMKKAAITSMALLTLAGGASSAFADGKGKGHGQDGHKDAVRGNGKAGASITLHFKDEKELKWALQYIVRLASKGVFNGYEDGTFKPHQSISRIETIVAAVRLMGLKEQAESQAEMSTKLNFKDADLLAKKYPWAVGYAAVALEKDLFAETADAIQPNKPATRLYAATLLVKALGLEAEAQAKANTHLSFKDADKIPAGSVGYVAVAIEKGIVTGYGDNTFRPNQPVTRAELAALLDRTDQDIPDNDGTAITGKLKAAASNGAVTIVKPDNTEVTVAVDNGVFIFRDNIRVSLGALQAGDEVSVRTDGGKAIFIEVTKDEPQSAVVVQAGTLNSVMLNAQGKIAFVSITKDVANGTQAIILNADKNVSVIGDTAKLTQGQAVELTLANGLVTSIKIV